MSELKIPKCAVECYGYGNVLHHSWNGVVLANSCALSARVGMHTAAQPPQLIKGQLPLFLLLSLLLLQDDSLVVIVSDDSLIHL